MIFDLCLFHGQHREVCVVETAAVIRRLANKTLSVKISKGILDSYVDSILIRNTEFADIEKFILG